MSFAETTPAPVGRCAQRICAGSSSTARSRDRGRVAAVVQGAAALVLHLAGDGVGEGGA
jgi:hypothetical protein